MIAGSGSSQTDADGRWGDYSSMGVGPVDDCTFWYTTMYQASTGYNWSSQVGRFKFPSCVSFSVTSPPVSVSVGSRTLTANYGGSSNDQSSVSAGFLLSVAP